MPKNHIYHWWSLVISDHGHTSANPSAISCESHSVSLHSPTPPLLFHALHLLLHSWYARRTKQANGSFPTLVGLTVLPDDLFIEQWCWLVWGKAGWRLKLPSAFSHYSPYGKKSDPLVAAVAAAAGCVLWHKLSHSDLISQPKFASMWLNPTWKTQGLSGGGRSLLFLPISMFILE